MIKKQDIILILEEAERAIDDLNVSSIIDYLYNEIEKLDEHSVDGMWFHDASTHKPFCSNCSYTADKETTFCPSCGMKLMRDWI